MVAGGTGPLLARPGFVDGQGAALEQGAVEVGDGLLGPAAHLDEPEAARLAGFSVADDLMFDSIKKSTDHLTKVAEAEGQDLSDLSLYGNYAVFDTPLESIYGASNLDKLRLLKFQYDPADVMGLAGGWKF